jgi:ribose/xylose/arabinose/galactoside ABC-type transport system permease subunit
VVLAAGVTYLVRMRIVAALGVVGAGLGGVVALLAHFMSHTLPSHYYVGFSQAGADVELGSPPLVHPSFMPALPLAMATGLAIGAVLGVVAWRLNLRVARDGRHDM